MLTSKFLAYVLWSSEKMQSISLQGRPTPHNLVNAKNGEGIGPEKWRMYYFTVQTANTELLAAGQKIVSKISPRSWRFLHSILSTNAHRAGRSQQLLCLSSGTRNKRLEQNDRGCKLPILSVW